MGLKMKNNIAFYLIVFFLFISTNAVAQASMDTDRNLLVTEGIAEVSGQNDSVRFSVAVITNGEDLDEVSSENAEKAKKIIRSIKDLDIRNIEIKTSGYNVIPQRDYKVRPPRIVGYEVRNSIDIKLEEYEPEKLSVYISEIIGLALEKGANNIQSIQTYIKNRSNYEKEALTKAVYEAKERAEVLAKAAGVKIKKIVSITTQPLDATPRTFLARSPDVKMEANSPSPPIEIGESSIRVHVNMVFEID
jgi:uncharacterized protein